EALVADLREISLGYDEPRRRRAGPVEGHEVRPGRFQPKAHREGIDDLHMLDTRLQLLGARPLVPLEAELHVLGGDGLTVVELEPTAQPELVHESVRALRPRLCQAVADLLARQRADQPIVER